MLPDRVTQTWWFAFLVIASLPLFWTVWMLANGMVLSGDNAWIALRTFDIFSTNPPLTGMPSTSGLDAPGVSAYHPGPIQFIVLAPVYALGGWSPAVMAIAALGLNLLMVAIGLWAAWRIEIPAAKFAAVTASFIVVVGEQTRMMVPWNPRPVELGMVALLVLMWAILIGRKGCWPWFAFVTAVLAQSHLLGLPLVVFAVGVLVVLNWRFGAIVRPDLRELWVAGIILVCAWVLPLWDVLSNWPGNLGEIAAYITASRDAGVEPGPWIRETFIVRLVAYAAIAWIAIRRGRRTMDSTGASIEERRWGAGLIAIGAFHIGMFLLVFAGGIDRVPYLDIIAGAFWLLFFLLIPNPVLWWTTWNRWIIVAVVFVGFAVKNEAPAFVDSLAEWRDHAAVIKAAHELVEQRDDLPIAVKHYGGYSWINTYPAVILELELAGLDVHYDPLGRPDEYDTQRRISEISGEHWVLLLADQPEGTKVQNYEGMLVDDVTLDLDSSPHSVTLTLWRVE